MQFNGKMTGQRRTCSRCVTVKNGVVSHNRCHSMKKLWILKPNITTSRQLQDKKEISEMRTKRRMNVHLESRLSAISPALLCYFLNKSWMLTSLDHRLWWQNRTRGAHKQKKIKPTTIGNTRPQWFFHQVPTSTSNVDTSHVFPNFHPSPCHFSNGRVSFTATTTYSERTVTQTRLKRRRFRQAGLQPRKACTTTTRRGRHEGRRLVVAMETAAAHYGLKSMHQLLRAKKKCERATC